MVLEAGLSEVKCVVHTGEKSVLFAGHWSKVGDEGRIKSCGMNFSTCFLRSSIDDGLWIDRK